MTPRLDRQARRAALAAVLVIVSLIGGAVVGGCKANPEMTAVDDAGRELTLEKAPEKIVSMAPSNTEILFALGLGDRVVGVTNYCNYPPQTDRIQKVGDEWGPDYETIVALEPDLVLAVGTADSELVKGLEGYGLNVFVLQAETVDQVAADIELVGKITGVEEAGKTLAADLRSRIAAVGQRVDVVAGDEPPTVFWALDDSLWTVGPGSFIDDVIRMAGGVNVGDSLGVAYGQFSMESLLEADPDVIIIPVLDESIPDALARLDGWSSLTAVKEGRVYQIDPDIVSRPGPRVAEAVEQVADLLYPVDGGSGN